MIPSNHISLVFTGSVDVGKSTTIGVVTKYTSVQNGYLRKDEDANYLDDGNGKMRNTVCNYKHEIDSGKTSSIAVKDLRCGNNDITLIDLCGHAKFLRTTLYGITSFFPDYGILIIAANKGVLEMTKEHLNIYMAYSIPFIILITKVENPQHAKEYMSTLNYLTKMFSRYRRKALIINQYDHSQPNYSFQQEQVHDIVNELKVNPRTTPIISISNTTGYYIDFVKNVLDNLIPYNTEWSDTINSVFYIDKAYSVKGIGIVLSGILKGKTIRVGDVMKLGPIGKHFIQIKVMSIHDNSCVKADQLVTRQRGCIAIKIISDLPKKFTKNSVKKGMVVMSENVLSPTQNVVSSFRCSLIIISSQNSGINMKTGYTPIIYCNGVRQAAFLDLDDQVQTEPPSDKPITKLSHSIRYTNVKFKFMYRPEFLEVGSKVIFVDNITKGRGEITSITLLE